MTWRTSTIVLAVALAAVTYRDCTRAPTPAPRTARCSDDPTRSASPSLDDPPALASAPSASASATDPTAPSPGPALAGFQIPSWATWLLPQPGEDLLAYRDRIVPIAQAAIAPQRARVARSLDDFATAARLDPQQRAALDRATQGAANAIETRVMSSVLGGDFSPATFKPMTAISVARDVLDDIDRGNQAFLASLTDDQRALLAQHPFDFADYLAFSTRWEDALGYVGGQPAN